MTNEMVALREMIGFAAERLMELEVAALKAMNEPSRPPGRKLGQRLDAFSPEDGAAYLRHAGYASI